MHAAAGPGNSFSALVPYAKEPYRELAQGAEIEEYARAERKRKKEEAAADALFAADKLKRQRVTSGAQTGGLAFAQRPPKSRAT
eukprot:jgi/Mesen1/4690/ME000241S03724